MTEGEYRLPSTSERALLQKLMEKSFPGRDELLQQLQGLTVRQIDREGSLALNVKSRAVADVQDRIPVEARYLDADATADYQPYVHVLLHVEKGLMVELEIYKDDGSRIQKPPHPDYLIIGWD